MVFVYRHLFGRGCVHYIYIYKDFFPDYCLYKPCVYLFGPSLMSGMWHPVSF